MARSSSVPLVLAIVFGSLVIGGAIVFLAMHHSGPAQPAPTAGSGPAALPQQQVDPEALARQIREQKAAFQAFASRLADAMARQRKAALESDNAVSDTVVTYTCNCALRHTGTLNAPNGVPTTFQASFTGSFEGKGREFHSTDTCEITAAFVPTPDGHWQVDAASEKTLTHKTSTDLFGVPEQGGQKRDISHIDWFHTAVNEAQKPDASKH